MIWRNDPSIGDSRAQRKESGLWRQRGHPCFYSCRRAPESHVQASNAHFGAIIGLRRSCEQHASCNKQGPLWPRPHASVKVSHTLKHSEMSMNASHRSLHCDSGHCPASQMDMLKPPKVEGLEQDYQTTSNIHIRKCPTNHGAWRGEWTYLRAYVSEMLKCHDLHAELSACICCCTPKYIIDVLMFSRWVCMWCA